MIKIAIPTNGHDIDNHFGHCQFYTIVTSNDGKTISHTETLPSPQGCGCKSNIAYTLRDMGVKVLLAGGIGDGAINVLNSQGISVVRGCSGNITQIAEGYLKGLVSDSGESCTHHNHTDDTHKCNH